MAGKIEAKLAALGIVLPTPAAPIANYIPFNISGKLVVVSGQVPVRERIGLSFASILRAILRQDPDVILLGEIRDHETADVAFHAALTGHLVFSTLHTNDAPSAVTRLMELGIPPYLINATLLGVDHAALVTLRFALPDNAAEVLQERLNASGQGRLGWLKNST